MTGGGTSNGNCVAGICGLLPTTSGMGKYVHGWPGGEGSAYNFDPNFAPINQNTFDSGGGGGAGAAGESANITQPGKGGDGLSYVSVDGTNYEFETVFGDAYTQVAVLQYIAGGGGGGGYCWAGATPSCLEGASVNGGKGGGGTGFNGVTGDGICSPGQSGTGSGGGGARGDGSLACAGGSGMVLIAFSNFTSASCSSGTYYASAGARTET